MTPSHPVQPPPLDDLSPLSALSMPHAEITLDGFPSTSTSLRTGKLLPNGAQQLAIRVKLWRASEEVLPEEWDTLTLLHANGDPVALLPIEEDKPPILEGTDVHWAYTWLRSQAFAQASTENKFINEENYQVHASHRVLYLHCTAPYTTPESKFYIQITTQGEQQQFLDMPIKVTIDSDDSKQPPVLTTKKIAGFNYSLLLGEPGGTSTYLYDYNPNTTEYVNIQVPGGFSLCSVGSSDEHEPPANRCSIVRFERDTAAELMCTVTGIVTNNNQRHIRFDERLLAPELDSVFGDRLQQVFLGELAPDSIIISIHRFDDIPAKYIPEHLRDTLFGAFGRGLTLKFRDLKGNVITQDIAFPNKGQNHHRNTLS